MVLIFAPSRGAGLRTRPLFLYKYYMTTHNYGITGSDLLGTPANLSPNPLVRQPTNTSLLGSNNFRLIISRLPAVTYFCQSANIPSVEVEVLSRANPFVDLKEIGKPSFGDFSCTFLVDETMTNWRSVYDWMSGISPFEKFEELIQPYEDMRSDMIVNVTTNAMNTALEVVIKGAFPTSLSAVEFSSSATDDEPIVATVTFAFDTFEVRTTT